MSFPRFCRERLGGISILPIRSSGVAGGGNCGCNPVGRPDARAEYIWPLALMVAVKSELDEVFTLPRSPSATCAGWPQSRLDPGLMRIAVRMKDRHDDSLGHWA